MNISGITWRGDSIDDVEILPELPTCLVQLLAETNGFVLHEGALHVRGAGLMPEWHSLRNAWRGPKSFSTLYPDVVTPSDIPFAQDLVGDQFLIRNGAVFKLLAESGELESFTSSLEKFFRGLETDIEEFLNIGLGHKMQPGELLHAFPPFCFQRQPGETASFKPLPAFEVILFHANLAKQIRDIPDGAQVEFRFTD